MTTKSSELIIDLLPIGAVNLKNDDIAVANRGGGRAIGVDIGTNTDGIGRFVFEDIDTARTARSTWQSKAVVTGDQNGVVILGQGQVT